MITSSQPSVVDDIVWMFTDAQVRIPEAPAYWDAYRHTLDTMRTMANSVVRHQQRGMLWSYAIGILADYQPGVAGMGIRAAARDVKGLTDLLD